MADMHPLKQLDCAHDTTSYYRCFFFFQAEDGIRDDLVTGVQTCALPIFGQSYLAISEAGCSASNSCSDIARYDCPTGKSLGCTTIPLSSHFSFPKRNFLVQDRKSVV